MGVLQYVSCIFSKHLFLSTPLEGFLWSYYYKFFRFFVATELNLYEFRHTMKHWDRQVLAEETKLMWMSCFGKILCTLSYSFQSALILLYSCKYWAFGNNTINYLPTSLAHITSEAQELVTVFSQWSENLGSTVFIVLLLFVYFDPYLSPL